MFRPLCSRVSVFLLFALCSCGVHHMRPDCRLYRFSFSISDFCLCSIGKYCFESVFTIFLSRAWRFSPGGDSSLASQWYCACCTLTHHLRYCSAKLCCCFLAIAARCWGGCCGSHLLQQLYILFGVLLYYVLTCQSDDYKKIDCGDSQLALHRISQMRLCLQH